MRSFNSRLFWKYITSYFCVLMIPLLCIGFFTFDFFTNYLEKDIINNNRDMLTQVKNIVDIQQQEIENISFQISSDPNLTPYNIKNNAGYRGVQTLRNYMSTNRFIHEMFLYIRGEPYLYSPSSSYTPDRLYEKYHYKNWNIEDFEKTINTSVTSVLRPAEDVDIQIDSKNTTSEKLITFVVPIPVYDPFPYGTVIYQVKEKMVTDLIKNILENYSGNTIIIDNWGHVVSSFKDSDYIQLPEFKKAVQYSDGNHSEKVVLNGEEYLLSTVKSDRSKWSYITLIPTREIMAKVSGMKWNAIVGLVIVLAMSSGLIYYFSFQHYNPIKKLKEFAESKSGKNSFGGNEIEAVRLVVGQISDMNQNLSTRIQSSKAALRDFLLFQLLKGQIFDIQEFNARGEEVQLTFTKPSFMVVVFYFHHMEKMNGFRKQDFISALETDLPNAMEGYAKESMDDQSVVLLLSSDQLEYRVIQEYIELIKKSVNEQWGLQVTVGVGSRYEEPHLIGKSYMEALSAYNYRFVLGNNKVIIFRDISGKLNGINHYPKHEIDHLELALKREDHGMVTEMIENIIQSIKESHTSIFMARCLCYDVINTIMKIMTEMNMSNLLNKNDYPDVVALMRFETVEELEYEVKRVCFDILHGIKENKKGHAVDLKTRMLAYIQQNFCDSNFSVQSVAEHYGISASYVSRYFKEQTGQSISDYVNSLRMKQAEELLRMSDDSLQNIVYQVGYFDVSSFIRKFKTKSGLTPGEFRKMYRA